MSGIGRAEKVIDRMRVEDERGREYTMVVTRRPQGDGKTLERFDLLNEHGFRVAIYVEGCDSYVHGIDMHSMQMLSRAWATSGYQDTFCHDCLKSRPQDEGCVDELSEADYDNESMNFKAACINDDSYGDRLFTVGFGAFTGIGLGIIGSLTGVSEIAGILWGVGAVASFIADAIAYFTPDEETPECDMY